MGVFCRLIVVLPLRRRRTVEAASIGTSFGIRVREPAGWSFRSERRIFLTACYRNPILHDVADVKERLARVETLVGGKNPERLPN